MASASSSIAHSHDLGDAAVVAEVDHLRAAHLQQPADHVDRRIMPVEQRRGGDEAQGRPGSALVALRDRATLKTGVHVLVLTGGT